MSGTFHTINKSPCKCGHNRWKTKGDREEILVTEYQCRKCGFIRQISRKEVYDETNLS